jgi:glutamine---fructose-6-phosphate transaminase (isomerizing)
MIEDASTFKHHMLKEIFEQPGALVRTIESLSSPERIFGSDWPFPSETIRQVQRILIAASGSSRHAGMAGKVMIETLAHVPVEVGFSSELQYSQATVGPETLVIVITQSGETADTLAALRAMKRKRVPTLAISNVADSAIMREADTGIHTQAGPELAIPATKSFSTQVITLFMFALWCAQHRSAVSFEEGAEFTRALALVPTKVRSILDSSAQCQQIAQKYSWCEEFFFAGRGVHYGIALDGALKLKESSYLHAEAFPAGEIAHGPLALVDDSMTAVVIATRDETNRGSMQRYEKNLTLLQQLRDRAANIIAVANEPLPALSQLADDVIEIPSAPELLLPLIEIVPLQLFAYYTAAVHGRDVDRPRNLLKAVISE